MNNISVAILKALLTSACMLTIGLSIFLITLIFDMMSQEGIPPLLNIKASIAIFLWVILAFIISSCIRTLLYAAIDSRDFKCKKIKIQNRDDDISI